MRRPKTRKDLEHLVSSRVMKDAEFRKNVLANPKAVLAKEYQIKLPKNLKLKILEDTAKTTHLVLPPTTGLTRAGLNKENGQGFSAVNNQTGATAIQFTCCC